MNDASKTERSLEDLIAELPTDPADLIKPRKLSVREAIIGLRDKVGIKVFTKRHLIEMIEVAHPQLKPVAMANLEASLNRAKEHVECVKVGEPNVYRFKQKKKK